MYNRNYFQTFYENKNIIDIDRQLKIIWKHNCIKIKRRFLNSYDF